MGQAMAAHVLCTVAGQPFNAEPVPPMSLKAGGKLAQQLSRKERDVFKNPNIVVDREDIAFICMHIWRGKCAVTGERMERIPIEVRATDPPTHRPTVRTKGTRAHATHRPFLPLQVTRWRVDRGDGLDNYVLLKRQLAKDLDEKGVEALPAAAVAKIDEVLAPFRDLYTPPLGKCSSSN